MKRLALATTIAAVLLGCSREPRFELRGLRTEEVATSSGSGAVTFMHRGTVIMTGAPKTHSYIAVYRVHTVSGGDPEQRRTDPFYETVVVERGIGDLQLYGGYRPSDEHWAPEKLELTLVGAVRIAPAAAVR